MNNQYIKKAIRANQWKEIYLNKENLMKSVIHFILLWFVALLLILIFILPNTPVYRSALEKFDDVVIKEKFDVPPKHQKVFYEHGFAVGYTVAKHPLLIAIILLVQTIFVVLVFLYLKRIPKTKPKNILLPDPLQSIKNILSNLLLFTFGVFNHRASEQLSFYFDLPVRSRIIGLFAYATIFFAITISYNMPKVLLTFRFTLISFLQVLFVVVLLLLVFFYKPFRKNYKRKLFWYSFGGLAVMLALSTHTGFQLAKTQLDTSTSALDFSTLIETKTMVVNLLIVLAFSFYIEIMKQVSIQKAQMEAEMSVARRIQNDLLPVLEIENKTFELYGQTVSATEVGGDYCDVIALPDNRFAVAVGDVSGHNVAAGVMMSMLKVAFRTELSYLTAPERLISSLNRSMYDHKNKNMFISFLFCLIDPASNTLTLINCGHPPLLHFSSDGQVVQKYRTGDVALGLIRDAAFKSIEIKYNLGDIFILLSDGLIETANSSGEEFTIETVSELIKEHPDQAASELYDLLVHAANEFRGQLPHRDDVTVTVVKMN